MYKITALLFLSSLIPLNLKAQAAEPAFFTIDSIYEKSDDLLLFSEVIEFDSTILKAQLIEKFKNWGGSTFRNFETVLVAESESQITLNFIQEYRYNAGLMYIDVGNYYQLIAQFKDNRIRILVYDDGNVYVPGSQYGAAIQAHSTHYRNYFRNKDIIYNKGGSKGIYNRIKGYIDLNMSFKQRLLSALTATNTEPSSRLNDDW